tara:strand:+ start:834 stop:1388 length:555 start_codon:yes stop_codon:yes gene_type:complete
MRIKIEHIIIAALFVYILFLSMCNSPKIITETVVERYSDTTITHDTVIKEIVKHHWHVQPSNTDTVFLSPEYIATLDTFIFNINDSILDARITALSKSQPVINLSYKVKQFEIKESILIKDSVVVERLKNQYFIGAMVGGSQNSFMFAPKIDILAKNGFLYSGGYDIINKTVIIGIGKKISLKR